MRRAAAAVLLIAAQLAAFAQGGPAAAPPSRPPAKEGARSLLEEWRDTLSYGIDDEIMTVLDAMQSARETSLVPELVRLVARSRSDQVRVKVMDYLGGLKEPAGEQAALALLGLDPAPSADVTVAALRYLEAIGSSGLGAAARRLTDSEDMTVAGAAVRALKMDPGAGELLLAKLKDDRTPAELKPDMILALGALRYEPAFDELAAIVQDRSQDKAWRMYAADSLGRLGNTQAVPLLRALFAEDDALLRAYAAAALGRFNEPGVSELLMEALKDSNWRVRSTGCKALGERKDREAVPILAYKARRDPVPRVRLDAIEALGEIATRDAMDTLRDLYAAAGGSNDNRAAALDALVKRDIEGSVGAIEKVMAAEWGQDGRTGRIVELTASRLASAESPRLAGLYERFLGNPNPNVRAAALRGITINHLRALRERVEQVSREDPVPGVRREAQLSLDRL